ncbi:hypothetical protein Q9L58_003855 [Maublancomyces gigas]|uniref:Potassium channel domain-containing protein n=1 Tax=Discina gigas TaxID=1032678 RepID=A0ABR3GMQ5_9PEZI
MKTTLGRSVLVPYTFVGIALLGLVVAAIRNVVVEDARERLIKRHMYSKNIRQKERFGVVQGLRSGTGTSTMVGQVSDAENYAEFQAMRKRQKKLKKSRAFAATGVTIGVFVVFWIGGAALFAATEGWSFFEGFYFAFVSLITIGYGDYTVGTDAGRALFILWSFMAVPLMTILVSSVGDTIISTLQKTGVKEEEDDGLRVDANETPTTTREVQRGIINDNRVFLAPGTESEAGSELAELVQNKLPQDLVMLSEKLMRYAEDVVSTANREFSFADFREMQSDTGVSYNFQEVVMPFNEELVFLRTYMMAIERVKEELRLAIDELAALRHMNHIRS